MADQWTAMLEHLPPGADVFDSIKGILTDEMFPKFGSVYWSTMFLAVGVLAVTFIAILLAFYLNIRRKGFDWMIVHDGACTHISPKAWVPFFWGIMCALLIGQIAWTHMTYMNKKYTGSFVAYSIVIGAVSTMSFSCLTLHVWTHAPPFRRLLVRMNSNSTSKCPRSVKFINISLFVWCVFPAAMMVLPGRKGYMQGDMAGKTYAAVVDILDKGKATQDINALANLNPVMAQFEIMEISRQQSINLTAYVFSPFFIFYLFGAIFPAILLNVYIRNRIRDYDQGTSPVPNHSASNLGNSSRLESLQAMSVASTSAGPSQIPNREQQAITVEFPHKLPKDRPFANIITVEDTTPAPQHLQRIIDMQGARPADKSARLRKALRRDNQLLLAYIGLLCATGSLAFYQLTGAPNRLTPAAALKLSLQWEIWSFAIPISFLAALFLYDAIRNERLDEEALETRRPQPYSRQEGAASRPNFITLKQDVMVIEEYAMDDKPANGSDKETMYRV